MGCGSSSTQVQTFKEPEETHSRRHSSPKLVLEVKRPQSKNSSHTSRSSSASSRGKKAKHSEPSDHNLEHFSRNSSANTKRTYTIDHNLDGIRSTIGEEPNHEHETDNAHGYDNVHEINNEHGIDTAQESDNVHRNGNVHEIHNLHDIGKVREIDDVHEVDNLARGISLQTNIFITERDSEEQIKEVQELHYNDSVLHDYQDNTTKTENQEIQKVSNILDEDEQIILDNGLSPLDIPEVDESRAMKNYTIDDLANDKSLFKYGQNVYSNDIMQPIIQERIRQYKEVTTVPYMYGVYPVYVARKSGITRKEMKQLLPVCQVGQFVDLPPDQYLSRMKQDVQNIFEDEQEEDGGDGLADYKQQLSRWLQKYPNVGLGNKMSNYHTDPNEVSFPIVIGDPSEFRKWIVDWELFDTEVPESGAWSSYEIKPIHDPDLAKQVHEDFASMIELREDKSIEALDMTIDGEAAWFVIELEIVKNDTATEAQIKIWSLRERRTNLDDRDWMAKRRREIADIFLQRHDTWEPDVVTPYMAFAENLDEAWKTFQNLCNKPFDPPENYKVLYIGSDDQNTIKSSQDPPSVPRDQNDNTSQNILKLDNSVEHSDDETEGSKTTEGLIESNDNKSNDGGVNDRNNVQSTPVENAVQDNARPQMETMDSGLELDTSDAFYK